MGRGGAPLLPSPNRSRLLPTSITFLSGRTLAIARFGWGGVGGGGRRLGYARATAPRPPTPTLPHKGGGRRSDLGPSLRHAPRFLGARRAVAAQLVDPVPPISVPDDQPALGQHGHAL